jgi:DNA modification methylase
MILASSKEGDLIVIPFAGSGSEIVQCAKNGRYFIAAENNEVYVKNMILPRLEKERIRFTMRGGECPMP